MQSCLNNAKTVNGSVLTGVLSLVFETSWIIFASYSDKHINVYLVIVNGIDITVTDWYQGVEY